MHFSLTFCFQHLPLIFNASHLAIEIASKHSGGDGLVSGASVAPSSPTILKIQYHYLPLDKKIDKKIMLGLYQRNIKWNTYTARTLPYSFLEQTSIVRIAHHSLIPRNALFLQEECLRIQALHRLYFFNYHVVIHRFLGLNDYKNNNNIFP